MLPFSYDDEKSRISRYLDNVTGRKILGILDSLILEHNMAGVLGMAGSGVASLLKNRRLEELKHAYNLFSRVDGGQDSILKEIELYLEGEKGELFPQEIDAHNIKIANTVVEVGFLGWLLIL